MAKKKALVLGTDGEIEQLQAGDYIFDESYIVLTNGEATTVVVGAPVYMFGADTFKKANNAAIATSKVIGLVADIAGIATSATGNIQEEGVMTLSTAQWDAVAGTTGGLAFGVKYFLGGAGLLTATVPTSGINAPVGIAISTTELKLSIERVVRL